MSAEEHCPQPDLDGIASAAFSQRTLKAFYALKEYWLLVLALLIHDEDFCGKNGSMFRSDKFADPMMARLFLVQREYHLSQKQHPTSAELRQRAIEGLPENGMPPLTDEPDLKDLDDLLDRLQVIAEAYV